METMITQRYTEMYNRRNQTVGVFVGLVDKGVIRTSWSRVSLYMGDKFKMDKGIIDAIKNMAAGKEIPLMSNVKKYTAFADEYERFRYRCTRFFKQYKLEGVSPASPSIDLSSVEGMFGKDVKDVMAQFLTAGLPLAEQLQRQGIMGIGIPVGMGSGINLAQMMKLINIDGKDVNHPETPETPEVQQTTVPVDDPITACDSCNGVKGKDCPVMDGVCNK